MSYFPPPFSFPTLTNMLAQRLTNTNYTNGSKPRLIIIGTICQVGSSTGVGSRARIQLKTGATVGAYTVKGEVDLLLENPPANQTYTLRGMIVFVIPPNDMYQLAKTNTGNLSFADREIVYEADL